MGIELTPRAQALQEQINIEPQLVLEIDGVPTVYGARPVKAIVKIGDPGLVIGGFKIGEFREIDGQNDLIMLDGTTTDIKQQLLIDKGKGSSIQSMQISLLDKDLEITNLITPGLVVTDLLGQQAKVWMGFAEETSWKEDFFIVFRGIVSDILSGAGAVVLTIDSPEQKKKAQLFHRAETTLSAGIGSGDATIPLTSVADFLTTIVGPDTTTDPAFTTFVRINDELIKYTGISGSDLTGATRGELGTIPSAHTSGDTVTSFYRLTEDVMHLALKLMLSGWGDNFVTGVEIESFVAISPTLSVDNSIFFQGIDVEAEYGLFSGDFITTVSSGEGANNVTLKAINEVIKTDNGSYITVSGVTFVEENDSPATVSFRSQFDTFPEGLKMTPGEVDVARHDFLFRVFLSSFNVDIFVKDIIENAKDFIEQELYAPAGSFSVPRKGRSSVNIHAPPIPGTTAVTLSQDNIMNPGSIVLKRSVVKNFFNTIVYQYEDLALEDRFIRGIITVSATSKARVDVGNKTLVLKSTGMRDSLGAAALAATATSRRLDRYKFGAEFFDGVRVLFNEGITLEVGDVLIMNFDGLNVSNTVDGSRTKESKFFEIVNRNLNLRTGAVTLSLVDTGFDGAARYGLISPASKVSSGISTTKFVIKPSFNTGRFGVNEFKKWDRFLDDGLTVVVRKPDFSTSSSAAVSAINGNEITLASALSFTPAENDIMEMSKYNDMSDQVHLLYSFMTDAANFDDGSDPYRML